MPLYVVEDLIGTILILIVLFVKLQWGNRAAALNE